MRAAADGKVAQVLDNPEAVSGGYGEMITLEHGAHDSGMFSQYIYVKPLIEHGVEVKKGDIIAELYKDPEAEEGRLVHLHMTLVRGWGTRGTSIFCGGKNIRTDDPKILSKDIYRYTAEPQGSAQFGIQEIPHAKVETANFRRVRVNQ
ncbi:MAG: M23 family metallopeptidase [Firmicutes bacterium]|nr:M23 family metallopeptidase [Bacillota bacterium]